MKIIRTISRILALLLVLVMALSACDIELPIGGGKSTTTEINTTTSTTAGGAVTDPPQDRFDFSLVPKYSKETAPDGYYVVNNNVPFFDENDMTTDTFEIYGEFDSLGRATLAYALLGKETMPTDGRGDTSYDPTGWHSVSYPETGNQSLYNRSHLIAWSLAGENNTRENLITGTQYFNQFTMQIFENQLLSYIRANDTHVLYRVTPVFEGNNLIAAGVLMEAYSVEDEGEDIMFCVFAYNVQEGIDIDYLTGESKRVNSGNVGEKPAFDGTFYDFGGFASSSSPTTYRDRQGSDGWELKGARTDKQAWIGDAPQVVLNGKSSAPGKIISPAISGGISELYMNYGLSFKDTKISFTVNILQNGVIVATATVNPDKVAQNEKYELHWVLDIPVEGEFVLEIVNNCPSGSGDNKDRLSVWNLGWK